MSLFKLLSTIVLVLIRAIKHIQGDLVSLLHGTLKLVLSFNFFQQTLVMSDLIVMLIHILNEFNVRLGQASTLPQKILSLLQVRSVNVLILRLSRDPWRVKVDVGVG